MSWSHEKRLLTLAVGSLAVLGLLSGLGRDVFSAKVVVMVALFPLGVFWLTPADELPAQLVRIAHVVASLWYAVVGIGLFVALPMGQPLPNRWPLCLLGWAIGAVPCSSVLHRAARGRYLPPQAVPSPANPTGALGGTAGLVLAGELGRATAETRYLSADPPTRLHLERFAETGTKHALRLRSGQDFMGWVLEVGADAVLLLWAPSPFDEQDWGTDATAGQQWVQFTDIEATSLCYWNETTRGWSHFPEAEPNAAEDRAS